MPQKGKIGGKQTDASSSSQASKAVRSKVSIAGKPTGARDSDNQTVTVDQDDEPFRTILKPHDQLQLTDQELKEEFTRILTATNPHAPKNIVRYSYKERLFKPLPNIEQLAVHFSMDGNMIHMESDEAKRQLAIQQGLAADAAERKASMITRVHGKSMGTIDEEKAERAGEEDEGEAVREVADGEGPDVEVGLDEGRTVTPGQSGVKEKKLTNQFNFSERASQTYNNPSRDRSTMTEPPPTATYTGNVTQWEIYDAYQEDFEKSERNKEKKNIPGKREDDPHKKRQSASDMQSGDDISGLIGGAAKIIERMVNQNTYDDVTQDFKYFEDQSDEFRDQDGTLLPLWRFNSDKVKKLAVTSLSWSPKYMDLCAVGHGSYEFLKQSNGMILFYTLKNPSFPEYIYNTDSGVMSLDIHPEHPYLLAVGFYDGNVGVFNILSSTTSPLYMSNAKYGKHTDPVWQVRWQKEDLDNNLNFFSLSSDGRIVSWTLLKNELHYHDIILLKLDDLGVGGPDGTQLVTYGSGTAFDFHPVKDYLFLVGTEEGRVHVCSKAYSSTFLDTYEAHNMAVYRVAWNLYHQSIFITCSADWTVKIWDRTVSSKEPIFSFDLGSAVGDVAWAPYSSTVFAAVTADGKVHVFDLNINKYDAICEQLVTQKKKTKLTHIAFNPKHPIILVGDDRGYVTSLKLSPNLRKLPKEKKGQEQMKPEEKETIRRQAELEKMEKILSMVRQIDPKEKKQEQNVDGKENKDDRK